MQSLPGKYNSSTHCFRRWLIKWEELDSGLLFAHTLSQTGSLNFQRYATKLIDENLIGACASRELPV